MTQRKPPCRRNTRRKRVIYRNDVRPDSGRRREGELRTLWRSVHACWELPCPDALPPRPQVGSGVGKEEQEIPLDINYSALSQWAVDRKRVSSDWRKRLTALQARFPCSPPRLPGALLRSLRRLEASPEPFRLLRSGQGEQLRPEAPRGHRRGPLQRLGRRRGRAGQARLPPLQARPRRPRPTPPRRSMGSAPLPSPSPRGGLNALWGIPGRLVGATRVLLLSRPRAAAAACQAHPRLSRRGLRELPRALRPPPGAPRRPPALAAQRTARRSLPRCLSHPAISPRHTRAPARAASATRAPPRSGIRSSASTRKSPSLSPRLPRRARNSRQRLRHVGSCIAPPRLLAPASAPHSSLLPAAADAGPGHRLRLPSVQEGGPAHPAAALGAPHTPFLIEKDSTASRRRVLSPRRAGAASHPGAREGRR